MLGLYQSFFPLQISLYYNSFPANKQAKRSNRVYFIAILTYESDIA